jgi:deoxyribodipyrimidine photo-lyase
MNNPFPIFTDKQQILDYVETINSVEYEQTRNYLDGSVTKLSPYITAGLITLNEIKTRILIHNKKKDSLKLIQELAWRDYFASVRQAKGEQVFGDLKRPQFEKGKGREIPTSILTGTTRVIALDTAVHKLYDTGYLHNHERMWLASVICNVAGTDWLTGAKWMYYYLVDGDLNSNMLSWQWVAGTFSSKKYIANQDNINRYARTTYESQKNTFLDITYEELDSMVVSQSIPEVLKDTKTEVLPLWDGLKIDSNRLFTKDTEITGQPNICTPHTMNFDTMFDRMDIVFVDKTEYDRFPFGQKKLDFLLGVGSHKFFYGTKSELSTLLGFEFEVPTQARMFDSLNEYYPSFFKYWDKAEKLI